MQEAATARQRVLLAVRQGMKQHHVVTRITKRAPASDHWLCLCEAERQYVLLAVRQGVKAASHLSKGGPRLPPLALVDVICATTCKSLRQAGNKSFRQCVKA
jgi:hypothetical protein